MGNTIAGIIQMAAFDLQANAFRKSGKLDDSDEDALTDDIDLAIVAALAQWKSGLI
jgi:hypothetical protein